MQDAPDCQFFALFVDWNQIFERFPQLALDFLQSCRITQIIGTQDNTFCATSLPRNCCQFVTKLHCQEKFLQGLT
jgi:hypothetical protein